MKTVRVLAVVAALVLLGGCGIHPGAAAKVGDATISTAQIDTFADGFCQFTTQPGQPPIPRAKLVDQTVNQMVITELQTQFAKAQGVTIDRKELDVAMNTVSERAAQISPELRGAFLDDVRRIVIGELSQRAAGLASLQKMGIANPTTDQANTEGAQLLQKWVKEQGIKVSVDPRYNPGPNGQAGGGDGSISRRVSAFAKDSAEASKPAYAESLPASQVCASPKS